MKPVVMPSYPHMMAMDIEVWSRYLADPVAPIKEVWYDVHVGGAVEVPGGPESLEGRIAAGITRKRIDVVCRVGGGYWVVEVKPFGSMLALGQVVSYHRLFMSEFRPDGEAFPVIVCENVDPDLLDEFEAAGVLLVTV
ncbi:hypothetical protein ES703_18306 [subsurface metagenome]